ncbi:MAG: hypothetical protein AAGF71_04560 [Pseudomonadota bacterium]
MSVTDLKVDEFVRFEPRKLADLYRTMGEIGAENVLCDAMEDLTIQLVRVEKLAKRDRLDSVHDVVMRIVPVAERIGLLGLARVARDVAGCIEVGDKTALAATLARLNRIGDKSLTAIWDPQNLSV